MYCKNCGKENNDSSKFCAGCGASLQDLAQETAVLQQLEPQPQPEVETQSQVQDFAPTVAMPEKPKKKKGIKAAVLAAVIMVLAVIIGVGAFTVSKLNSPLVKIGRGLKNLTTGTAYTYEISLTNDQYPSQPYKIHADIKFDLKGKNIDATNITVKLLGDLSNMEMEAFLHTNDKEVGFVLDDSCGNKGIFYNGYGLEYTYGELDYATYMFDDFTDDEEKITDDIFEEISLLFDFANGDADIEAVEKKIISIVNEIYPEADLNENKIVKIDPEIEKQVTKELKKCLTDEEWLKENLGLSVSKDGKETVYTFDIDIDKAVNSLYDILKPLLKDVYNQTADFLGDEYGLPSFNSVVDEFMDDVEYMAEDISSLIINIGMTKNQITSINAKIKQKYYGYNYGNDPVTSTQTISLNVEISKADNFKAPNVGDYKIELDKAKESGKENGIKGSGVNEKTCANNIKCIKANVAMFASTFGEPVSSISDIQEMFDDGQMPECPLSDNGNHYDDYIVEIDSNGMAKVYCRNYGINGHFPDGSETEAPQNPLS